jgi:hypothetical protein
LKLSVVKAIISVTIRIICNIMLGIYLKLLNRKKNNVSKI